MSPIENKSSVLERLAELLRNVTKAWKDADQELRNRLARQLFDEIWVKDKQVIAVRPRPELKPFFQLSYEEWLKKFESENPKPPGVASQCLRGVTRRTFFKIIPFSFPVLPLIILLSSFPH